MVQREVLSSFVDLNIVDKLLPEFEEFFNSKSQKDRVMLYYRVEPYLTTKDLEEIFEDIQIKTITQRMNNSEHIIATDKDSRHIIYTLTDKGKFHTDKIIKTFLDKNYKYQEYLDKKRTEKLNNSDLTQTYKKIVAGLITSSIKPDIEGKIKIDLKELAEYDFEACDLIYADPKTAIEIIKEHYKDAVEDAIKTEDIIFLNPHESIYKDIHDYDRDYQGLVFTKGLITSKKESITLQVRNYVYLCSNDSCTYSQDKIITGNKLKTCPKCKTNLNLIDQIKVNHFEAKISNIDSGISFPLVLRDQIVKDFAFIGLGDEIEVIGHLEEKTIKQEKGDKEEIIKCLVVNSFKKTDFQKDLTLEEKKTAERILNKYPNPKDYLMKCFKNYIGDGWIKELFLLQQLTLYRPETKETTINIAFMGEPGVGKDELIRVSKKFFPNNESVGGADITDAGFKGTVNRDTGIKEIGLAKKTQHGTIWLNEFDKFVKSNPNGKKAASQLLNSSITEQEIKLNKAGIKISFPNLDLRHNLTFNPVEESIIDTGKPAYHFMSQVLDKSLLSRMIPLYIQKDKKRSLDVFDLMLQPKEKELKLNIEDYKTLIKYLRFKQVFLNSEAKKQLKKVYEDIIQADTNSTISAERIGQILIQISKAYAKFYNFEEVNLSCVQNATSLYWKALSSCGINLNNLENLFLEKSIEEIKTIKDIKIFIINKIKNNNSINLEDIKDLFDPQMLQDSIYQLKQTGDYAEFKKGELKKVN